MIKPLGDRFKFTLDGEDITGDVDSVTVNTDISLGYDCIVKFKSGCVEYYPFHRFAVELLPQASGV